MRRSALLVGAVLALSHALHADEDAAGYFVQRGGKALADGQLDQAKEMFLKSLGEMDGYIPALLGLARVAQARDDTAEAVRQLEVCLKQPEARTLGRNERDALARAKALLDEIDRPRGELRRIHDEYVSGLLKLAQRSVEKKPLVARECLERILRLRPNHPSARKMLAALSEGGAEPETGNRLWNGKDLANWTGGPPIWTVKDGVLLGEAGGASYWMRARSEVKGDFVLECELRIVKDSGTDPLFEICFGADGAYHNHGLWLVDDEWRLVLRKGEQDRADLRVRKFKLVDKSFNLFRWQTYRIEVKGRRISCWLGTKKIFDHKTPADEIDGFIGLSLQHRSVEIRRLVLRRP